MNQASLDDIVVRKWHNWTTVFTDDASKLHGHGDLGAAVWFPKFNVLPNVKFPN